MLPIHIDKLLQEESISVKVLPTEDQWFRASYWEDKELVRERFRRLIEEGVYQGELYADL